MENQGKIKIAYLISVYKDPIQFGRMIKALFQGSNTFFFVHTDAKCNQLDFENAIPKQCKENVQFTSNRYWIQWGGYNQVKYQKELLKECISFGEQFDRVFILTGQDYPLISNNNINQILNHTNKEFIIGLNISNIKEPSKIRNKLVLYHFFRDMKYVPYKVKKVFSGGCRILFTIIPLRKKTYIMINGKRWDVFQSSSYMCITFQLCKYIYSEMQNNKTLMSYFKYSFVPEEMVIPTITFNSPFRKNCMYYEKGTYDGLKTLSAITYFNYGKEIQTFTLDNYDELKNSGKMFARKFATGISDSLMNRLDKEHGL